MGEIQTAGDKEVPGRATAVVGEGILNGNAILDVFSGELSEDSFDNDLGHIISVPEEIAAGDDDVPGWATAVVGEILNGISIFGVFSGDDLGPTKPVPEVVATGDDLDVSRWATSDFISRDGSTLRNIVCNKINFDIGDLRTYL